MEIGVVVAGREEADRPPDEAIGIAEAADGLGFAELWVGESGPTWDGFVLAAAIGRSTRRIPMTVGPVPVSVRDPATIARAASSVAAVSGRPVGVALGTSSVRMVEGVHGRSRVRVVTALEDSARAVAVALRESRDDALRAQGFGQRLPPAGGALTVAAFGERAVAVAARHADRMLVDLVSPEQVGVLRGRLDAAAATAGRRPPRLAAWLPAAVDPSDAAYRQVLSTVAGYLTVAGYAGMFAEAGFGRAVELARGGAPRDALVAALPREAAHTVGLVGDADTVRARLAAYADAGLDDVAVLPATAADPRGEHTLTTFSRWTALR